MKNLISLRDLIGNSVFGLSLTDYCDALVLVGGTAKTYQVPTKAKNVVISCNKDFFANFFGKTATIPTSDIIDGSASILNPTLRDISEVSSISFISEEDAIITLEFYS